jgi:hypothetical protein
MAAIQRTVSVALDTWGAPQVATTEFVPDQVSVVNMSSVPADVIEVSFDQGATVAATLTPGSAQAGYAFEVTAQKMWLRRTVPGAAVTCHVVFTRRM